jgi:uncharacterized membrane protein
MKPTFRSISKRVSGFHNDENGSLVFLIIGLFVAALTAFMVMTDVAVVANAKRSLDQATETAAMSALKNLDKSSYYTGKHTILTSAYMALGNSDYADERVPVDCNAGWQNVNNEMDSWIKSNSGLKTMQIHDYEITAYECVYDVVHLETQATVKLPFPAPMSSSDQTTIKSSVTTRNEKDKGLWLFGFRLH